MTVAQREQLAAILEHEAEAVGDQPRTHAAEVGLNHGDHHAAFVGGAEVGGVAVAGSLARIDGLEDAIEANELGALLRVILGVKPVDGDFCEVRVGIVAGAVFVGQALGFNLDVEGLRGLETESAHVELLDHVEHLQRSQPLCVGGHGINVDAAVAGHQRFIPLGMMRAQIFGRASLRCA